MCHRARFFALVTFVKNPEKSLPFQPIFSVCLRPMYIVYITGRRHSYY